MSVIPDAIEPIVGWKALRVMDTRIFSPNMRMQWLPGQMATARCQCPEKKEWRAIHVRDPLYASSIKPEYPGFVTTGFVSMTATAHSIGATGPTGAIAPANAPFLSANEVEEKETGHLLLPPGFEWRIVNVPVHDPEDIPHADCSCGIYLAEDPRQLPPYQKGDSIICQVKGWGKVIRGEWAHRVLHAYPSKIYVTHHGQAESCREFGVPVLSLVKLLREQSLPPGTFPRKPVVTHLIGPTGPVGVPRPSPPGVAPRVQKASFVQRFLWTLIALAGVACIVASCILAVQRGMHPLLYFTIIAAIIVASFATVSAIDP